MRVSADRQRFHQLSSRETGIRFRHQFKPRNEREEANLDNGFSGGGVSTGDYDADGLPDLLLTRPHGGPRLYRNLGDFKFEDVTLQSRVDDGLWSTGAIFADVNNDGWLDLYIGGYLADSRMYMNQRDGTFRDVIDTCGLPTRCANVVTRLADYDRDGDLDAFVLTHREPKFKEKTFTLEGEPGDYRMPKEFQDFMRVLNFPDGTYKLVYAAEVDYLFRNDTTDPDDVRFTDVTGQAGIAGNYHGVDATWWDYNNDGWPDLYVSNDFTDPDQLLRNNQDGTFSEVSPQALPHTPWFSMGAASGDLNGDGHLDLIGTDMAATTHYQEKISMGDMERLGWFLEYPTPRQYMRNVVFMNSGTDRFLECAWLTGLAATDWTWSVMIADLDGDRREDVFITNGFTRNFMNSDLSNKLAKSSDKKGIKFWETTEPRKERNRVYKNHGDFVFRELGKRWGLDNEGVSFGCAMADMDGDGDLDIAVNNYDSEPLLYRNDVAQQHRIKVRLVGQSSNRFGIGAKVTIDTTSDSLTRHLTQSSGFMSAGEPTLCIGLGATDQIKKLSVHWPSGQIQEFENLEVDRSYTISESDRAAEMPSQFTDRQRQAGPADGRLFERSEILGAIAHQETPYDDFKRQPLLPNRLSQLGPKMAWGDVDGDGDDDMFLGGAAGFAGQMIINHGQGQFQAVDVKSSVWELDKAAEDMGALLADIDGDKDLDLYVVSGGVECEAEDTVLHDRLYLNDGRGNFTRASDETIDASAHSGSVAVACDYDNDGDLDLFVGGRVIPGQYPLGPGSRLLRNGGGRFEDVTSELAPALNNSDMVTGAVWSDIDQDGWSDLVVTCEYGPVRCYGNQQGRLVDRTEPSGLIDLQGWWNSITVADVDNDGDMDYAVTNFGLNTKYHPTRSTPQMLFYGDFDRTGLKRIVEAKWDSSRLLPVRGRSCSTRAMPFLGTKFNSFHDFASVDLTGIYTSQSLSGAKRLQANTLSSGILINDGQGSFSFQPFPKLAQFAPSFAACFLNVDGDEYVDLVLAQNFFGPQPETGRMAGGLSVLLRGLGDGTFQAIWPNQSGIVVPEDAKSVAAADLNGDRRLDLVFGINDGKVVSLLRTDTRLND